MKSDFSDGNICLHREGAQQIARYIEKVGTGTPLQRATLRSTLAESILPALLLFSALK